MLINWNTNVERYQFSFKMICIQQNFYYKPSIYGNFFVEVNKLILYFTSKCKGSRKSKKILEESNKLKELLHLLSRLVMKFQ